MGAAFDNTSVLEKTDQISVANGRDTMGGYQRRPV